MFLMGFQHVNKRQLEVVLVNVWQILISMMMRINFLLIYRKQLPFVVLLVMQWLRYLS